eukprot:555100_1
MATVQANSLNFHNHASSPTTSRPTKPPYLLQITNNPKYNIPCRYNPTRTGCRYANSCYYQHLIPQPPLSTNYPQTQLIQQIQNQKTPNNYHQHTNQNQIPTTPHLTHEIFQKNTQQLPSTYKSKSNTNNTTPYT